MSRIFDFQKRFGQDIDINDLKRDFVNKVNHNLVEPLDKSIG